MSERAKPLGPSVLHARFSTAVRLGPNELNAWHAERPSSHSYSCEATQAGLVFAAVKDDGPDGTETVVPWANVISYERRRL